MSRRSSPLQPQLLSRINEALVLRTIRQHGPLSRVELSQRMGATFPTVAKAVGSLVGAHLLEEFEHVTIGPGSAGETVAAIEGAVASVRCGGRRGHV